MSNNPGVLRPFEGLSDDDYIYDDRLAGEIKKSLQTTRRYLDDGGVPHSKIGKKRIINVGVARRIFLNGGRHQGNDAA